MTVPLLTHSIDCAATATGKKLEDGGTMDEFESVCLRFHHTDLINRAGMSFFSKP
jgi:hypothetical protein